MAVTRHELENIKYCHYAELLRDGCNKKPRRCSLNGARAKHPSAASRQPSWEPGQSWQTCFSQHADYLEPGFPSHSIGTAEHWDSCISPPVATPREGQSRQRPSSAPAGGRRSVQRPSQAEEVGQESHLHEYLSDWRPCYGSIYADRDSLPGPGHYRWEGATGATLRHGPTSNRATRSTGEWFLRRDKGPVKSAAVHRRSARSFSAVGSVAEAAAFAASDGMFDATRPRKPVSSARGFSFSRARRM